MGRGIANGICRVLLVPMLYVGCAEDPRFSRSDAVVGDAGMTDGSSDGGAADQPLGRDAPLPEWTRADASMDARATDLSPDTGGRDAPMDHMVHDLPADRGTSDQAVPRDTPIADTRTPDRGADATVDIFTVADLWVTPVREPTLVILVAHAENTQKRPSPSDIKATMAVVSANFEEYSYNRMGLTGVIDSTARADVVGWFTSKSQHCFDLGEYFDLADSQVDFVRYTRVVVVLATRPTCTLAAWATLERKLYNTPDGSAFFGLVKMSMLNAKPGTLTHEIGHTLRNGHGAFLDCGAKSWAASGCKTVSYGDPYDAMSTGIGHFSARRKEAMGWMKGPNRILEVRQSGEYSIEPMETNTGGIKALKLSRGPTEHALYIEYRQPIGTDASFPADANVFKGALLHAGSNLIDATPPAATYGPLPPTDSQLTPVLPVGSTFVDPLTGHSITVLSKNSKELRVRVVLR